MKVEYVGEEADWIEYAPNMFFYKDSEGFIWQLIKTPFEKMPVAVTETRKAIVKPPA